MNLSDAALASLMGADGWSVQLRRGHHVVHEQRVTPVKSGEGWRIDALFGPWTRMTSWSEVVLVSAGGVEEIEAAATTLPPGRAYAHTIRVTGG